MPTSIVNSPGRWFVRGLMVGILISGALNAVSYFFRSERGGNLLGITPQHYEALGFPCTLWETGNTYGGLFVDLRALAVNALFAGVLAAGCGLATLRFQRPLTNLVERLEETVTVRQQGPVQVSLKGLLMLCGLASLVAAGAHYALAGQPAVLGIIYGLGPWILVLFAFVPMGLSWQQRVIVLVPAAPLLMLVAVLVGNSLKPPLEFDKVLLYIFVCWTPQSVIAALGLTLGLILVHTSGGRFPRPPNS